MCEENKSDNGGDHLPVADFSTVGFAVAAKPTGGVAEAHAKIKDLKALRLSVCVGASFDGATRKLCFHIPVYGDFCITIPVSIPISGDVKVCAETCGSFIPTGVKATAYVNNNPVYTYVIVGSCS